MGPFFDMHSHMLCGVDDGADSPETMYAMLDASYADGVRGICLTPHYSPYLFGDTYEESLASFELLKAYAARKYPDLQLFLGHELGYHEGCERALADGRCRTLAGSRYLLVDFPENVDFFELSHAIDRLRSVGCRPILAHAERYRCLHKRIDWLERFVLEEDGVVQINASSGIGAWGMRARAQWKRLLKKGLVHIIATDTHNLTSRPPEITVCMDYLQKHLPPEVIRDLLWENPWRVINNRSL